MSNNDFSHDAYQKFLNSHILMGAKCLVCGATYLPPRPMCTACGSHEMTWLELHGEGKLAAYTVIQIAPTQMLEAGYGRNNPYCSGIVELNDGPAISAQILGVDVSRPEAIKIETPLRAVFVERGEGEKKQTFLAFEVG